MNQQRHTLFHVGAAMTHLDRARAELAGVEPLEPPPATPSLHDNIHRLIGALEPDEELSIARTADGERVDAYIRDGLTDRVEPMELGDTAEEAVAALATELEVRGKLNPRPGCP